MPRLKYLKVRVPDPIVKGGRYYRLVPVAEGVTRLETVRIRRRRREAASSG